MVYRANNITYSDTVKLHMQ